MSNATGPQSLSRLLADSPAFSRLICEARSRAVPTSGLPELPLPPALAAHTRAQLEDNRLLLIARNASVAQMLRFHGPRLASAAGVSDFQVRVAPDLFADGTSPARPRPAPRLPSIPGEAAATLDSAADGIEHAPLASALRRLAGLARR